MDIYPFDILLLITLQYYRYNSILCNILNFEIFENTRFEFDGSKNPISILSQMHKNRLKICITIKKKNTVFQERISRGTSSNKVMGEVMVSRKSEQNKGKQGQINFFASRIFTRLDTAWLQQRSICGGRSKQVCFERGK